MVKLIIKGKFFMKRLRKAYHIIVAAVMTFCLISCADNAILSEIFANTIVSADEYNSFTYSINNGNASISKYNGTAENLVVPEKINGYPVTNIYGGAFQSNNYIKKVTIKSKITILYGRMFAHCSNLETVILPETLVEIKDGAFSSSGIGYITIPSSVTDINRQSFQGCQRLSTVTIKGTTHIRGAAFYNCKNLMNVELPLSCTLDSSAFDECTNLNYINGKKVTIIPPKNQYPLFDGELHDFVINQFERSNNVGFMNIYTSAFASKVVSDYTNSSMNDTQKAKALHDWLCDAVDYDHETTSDLKNHVDYSAFLYSTTVCDGYARAYYLLTKAAGIESYLVHLAGEHAWNIIKLGDHYFHVDATWDDGKGVGNRKYDYFLLSDSEMKALGGAHSSWSLSCPTILFTYDYGPVPLSNYMLGDINKDGTIDATDLTLLQNYLLGNGSINKGDAILADLNYDGVVDTFDLVVLRQKFNKQ